MRMIRGLIQDFLYKLLMARRAYSGRKIAIEALLAYFIAQERGLTAPWSNRDSPATRVNIKAAIKRPPPWVWRSCEHHVRGTQLIKVRHLQPLAWSRVTTKNERRWCSPDDIQNTPRLIVCFHRPLVRRMPSWVRLIKQRSLAVRGRRRAAKVRIIPPFSRSLRWKSATSKPTATRYTGGCDDLLPAERDTLPFISSFGTIGSSADAE